VDTALVFLARRMRGIHQGFYLELDSRVISGAVFQSYTWNWTPELYLELHKVKTLDKVYCIPGIRIEYQCVTAAVDRLLQLTCVSHHDLLARLTTLRSK